MPKSWKTPTRLVSLVELSEHTSIRDCWIAINGEVYDVTSYLRKHPGGNTILRGAGTDATALFSEASKFGHEHSLMAYQELKHYFIGTLVNAGT